MRFLGGNAFASMISLFYYYCGMEHLSYDGGR
jgi:hypothetical protein